MRAHSTYGWSCNTSLCSARSRHEVLRISPVDTYNGRVAPSKAETERESDRSFAALHRSARCQSARHRHEACCTRIRPRVAKFRCVSDIERLRSELHLPALSQFEISEQTCIEVDHTWATENVPPRRAKSNRRHRSKRRRVEIRCVAPNAA